MRKRNNLRTKCCTYKPKPSNSKKGFTRIKSALISVRLSAVNSSCKYLSQTCLPRCCGWSHSCLLLSYNSALGSISSTAAILAGFALTTLSLIPDDVPDELLGCETFAYLTSVGSAGFCLLTLVNAQFTALFSMRLALRGGENAVEETIKKARGEFKVLLNTFVCEKKYADDHYHELMSMLASISCNHQHNHNGECALLGFSCALL